MKYRNVGKSGLKISEIAIGGWLTYGGTVDDKQSIPILKEAIGAGINFIDMSDIYSKGAAETVAGEAIKDFKRSDLVISSKVFWPMSTNVNDRGLSRKHIMESIDKSLQRLQTDYLDIYFCHRFDPETEIDETTRAMDDLVKQGKILYWGTSVWTSDQINSAVSSAEKFNGYLPIVEQPRYNMLDRTIEKEIMPTCSRHGLGLVVWSPLAQGLLTGKYLDGPPPGSRGAESRWMRDDLTDENIEKTRKLKAIADRLGIKLSQLALAWILTHDEISCAITGATTPEQVQENVMASEVKIDDDTMKEIETIIQ